MNQPPLTASDIPAGLSPKAEQSFKRIYASAVADCGKSKPDAIRLASHLLNLASKFEAELTAAVPQNLGPDMTISQISDLAEIAESSELSRTMTALKVECLNFGKTQS